MPSTADAVASLYRLVLQREPDPEGLAFFTAQIDGGGLTLPALLQTLVGSTETQQLVDPVVGLYQVAFGRVPDQGGIDAWVDLVARGGATIPELAQIFAGLPEFASRFGASEVTTADYVQTLYRQAFSRDGGSAEVEYWMGTDRVSVLLGIAQSEEFTRRALVPTDDFLTRAGLLTEDYAGSLFDPDPNLPTGTTPIESVAGLYRLILQREADLPGLTYFTAQLEGGTPLADIAQALIASAEAQDFVQPVIRLYQVALGRVPDQGGLAGWAGLLAKGGLSLDGLAATIIGSGEYAGAHGAGGAASAADIQSFYQNAFGRAADAGELDRWLGQDRAAVLTGIAQSDPFLARAAAPANAFLAQAGGQVESYQGPLFDDTAPGVTVSFATTLLEPGQTTTVSFAFSEAVRGFELADLAATNGTLSALVQSPTDPTIYSATFTAGAAGPAAVTLAGAYRDLAGNAGLPGSAAATVQVLTPATPALSVLAATGAEDQPIALAIASALVAPAAGETLSVTVAGLPAGASLTAGTANGDGSWTLTPGQLAGLGLLPPADFSGAINLVVTATARIGDQTASSSAPLGITVAAVADAPTLGVAGAPGLEDQPILLAITAGLVAPTAGESLAITIAGLPAGASLSAGSDLGGGVWAVTPAQLSGLTLTPPANFAGTLALTVTATATAGGSQSSTGAPLLLTVAPVVDAPGLAVAPALGLEDQPVVLAIDAGLIAPAEGEALSVVITGVPAGATLSAGTDNGGGAWSLTGPQLAGLTLTPPPGFSGSLALVVTATAQLGATQASSEATLEIVLAPVADAPSLTATAADGIEDLPVVLTIASALADPAPGESLAVAIAGLPAGASLSAGTDHGDGSWGLTAAELVGLVLTPPPGFSGTLALTVTATATAGGSQASSTAPLSFAIAPAADAPSLSVVPASGREDLPVALAISAGLVEAAPGELLSVTIADVPAGALLSAGLDNGDGSWTLTPAQLAGLTLIPPPDASGLFTLTVTATAAIGASQAVSSLPLAVTLLAAADLPALTVAPASGLQGQPIALAITGALVAPADGEVLTLRLDGLPEGAVLSAGTPLPGGAWSLAADQLAGLTLTPPPGYSGALALTVTATASVDGTQATSTSPLAVTVLPQPQAPALALDPASGAEDQPLALAISAMPVDPAPGETLSLTIAGVPAGASLSAGTDNGDGSWTLTPAQLAGLTLTPPADFFGPIALTVTATAANGAAEATSTDGLVLTVTATADAPSLTATAAPGIEDQPVALSIAAALAGGAPGELLSVRIAGVPAGALLSAGTNNNDGSWTLTGPQLAGLTLTPPADFAGSIGLSVTATASVNGTQASHTEALAVTVAPVPDQPVVSASAAPGTEDQPIALSIAGALTSPTAGETLSFLVSGLPAGAVLSAGTDLGLGSWSLTPAQLSGLTLTPPANFSGNLALSVQAVASVDGRQATQTAPLAVTVAGVADAPTLAASAAPGFEDIPVALSIAAGLVAPSAGELLSVTITGVPAGASLSAGINNGGGSWTLTAPQLAGLSLTPPADFFGSIPLTVTATSLVNGTQASHSEALTLAIAALPDPPTVFADPATGIEDQAIALTIGGALVAPAPGETLSFQIAGLPVGAVLSAGTFLGFGTWSLSAAQLPGLTVTPPADFSGVMQLTARAVASVNGVQAPSSVAFAVSVAAVADAPTLTVAPAAGLEDQPIALAIAAGLIDPGAGELLSVLIAGVPAGAVLSAGSDNGDGSWTLTGGDLVGLTLTPPADFFGAIGLTVTATASVNGTQASHSEALGVTVGAAADTPSLTVAAASGLEDQPVALSIAAALAGGGGEVLSVMIAGLPAGSLLSAGSDNGDGSWTLTGAQLAGLTLTPPADFAGSLGLTVTATASVNGTQASQSEALSVTVAPVADAPSLTVAAASGLEDQPIALSIASSLVAGSPGEVLSVLIAGVPAGALLSAGSDNGDGSWTLTAPQLAGLTLTPPADFSGSLGLTVTATASVAGTQASHSEALSVTVAPVADVPSLAVAAASGLEDQSIALSISAGLTAPAAGETLSLTIAGVPAGALLSAGTDNGDGSWTLTVAELPGLTLAPPADFSGSLGLTVTAIASIGGSQASHSEALAVDVAAVADAPSLTVAPASGAEDQPIALAIAAALETPGAGEVLSVLIAGVPAGALLSAGSDNGDGSWSLTGAQLPGLTLTPPADFSGSLGLTVTATASVNGTQASHSEALTVTVTPEPDSPTLSVADAAGLEDQGIALSISAGLTSPAAGETLAVTILGVPVGAVLSAGSDNGDGSWTLTGAQLPGLTLTPPGDYFGSIALSVQAKASISGHDATTTDGLTVTVTPQVDAPTLDLQPVTGFENQVVALTFGVALVNPAPGEAVTGITIGAVPAGASLSAGIDNGDGTWNLTQAELAGLDFVPPEDFDGDIVLSIDAVAALNGSSLGSHGTLTVTITPDPAPI